jgi:hypothetical protein
LTAYLEQLVIFNAYNSHLSLFVAQNTTVASLGFGTPWCPSDGSIIGLRHAFAAADCRTYACSPMSVCYSSYACSMGTWTYWPSPDESHFVQKLSQMNGVCSQRGKAATK